ncbi:helix-turn-helix transcriptional regulator [Candidatus Dependentiae bacterium]|nr:helix-turn-helix transcriptional regulator [Candidatus Dependentiae bacterium]
MKTLKQYITEKEKKSPGYKKEIEREFIKAEIFYLLRKTREKHQISQIELAQKCRLSQQAISKIENAKDDHISLHTLNKYVSALGYRLNFALEPAL